MSQALDPNQYEVVNDTAPSISGSLDKPGSPSQAPHVAAIATAPAQPTSNPDAQSSAPATTMLQPGGTLKRLDMNTVELLPSYANGSSPSTPINESPVSALDRAFLSLGNSSGKVKFLKTMFEDVQPNDHGDLAVKKDGSWYRVNAKTFGDNDPWELSRKIAGTVLGTTFAGKALKAFGYDYDKVKQTDLDHFAVNAKSLPGDMADMTGKAIPLAGMMAGGALGGGVASVAGAAAGGAGGETIRTSLGRLAGTYDATPDQQLKDIGWEGLLATGGKAIELGAKPALGVLADSLGKMSDTMTNYGKSVFSKMWGHATGAGDWAIRRAMDEPAPIVEKVSSTLAKLGPTVDPLEGADILARDQAFKVTSMAKQAKGALQGLWQKNQADLLGSVPKEYAANLGGMMKDVQQEMATKGLGQVVQDGSSSRFVPFTPEQIGKRLAAISDGEIPADQLPRVLGPNSLDALKQLSEITNQYSKFPTIKGAAGAQKLLEFKRAVGESFDDIITQDTPQSIKRMVYGLKDSVTERIGQTFANVTDATGKSPLYDKYAKLNADYASKKDVVDQFNYAVDNGKVDTLVKQLVSKSGSFRSLKDEASHMADLLGDRGHGMIQDLMDSEAAKKFLPFVSQGSAGSSAGAVARTAAAVVQQSNPRAVLTQISVGNKLVDMMKSMKPGTIHELIGNDSNITKLVMPAIQSLQGEDQLTQQILQNSGVQK